jgi:excisionase family DNA binding protein
MAELRVVRAQPVLDELPEVLTVEEAAEILRIGRGTAYELARQWRETNGRHGLPVVVLGRSLRVPRSALAQMLDLSPDGDGVRASGQ